MNRSCSRRDGRRTRLRSGALRIAWPAWVAALCTAVVLALAGPPAGTAVASGVSGTADQVLFAGGTGGYGCYRIPALARTAAGTLLAFAEARKSPTCADRQDIDIVVRRSTNDGRSWGPVEVVLSGGPGDADQPYTRGNAAPVVDAATGRILLLSTSNPATPTGKRLPWVQHSDDDGRTWSPAEQLTSTFSGATNGWFATGPGHGVQLTQGAHAGRLVVGAHQVPSAGVDYAGVLYSDDHGATWQAGSTPNSYVADPANPGQALVNPGEVSVTELRGGGVYAMARNQIGGSANHRTRAVSTDGGTTMPAATVIPSLVTPDVQGSVLALRQTWQSASGDTLLFSGPADPSSRKNMTVRYSTDNGTSWKTPANGLITGDASGYSDLVEASDGGIGLLYETGIGFSADQIHFRALTPAALGLPGGFHGTGSNQQQVPAAVTTPDASSQHGDAYPRGGAALGPGRFYQGLVLDNTGTAAQYVDVPWSRPTDPGAGDFTYALWFKYQATAATAQQVLFWGYGVGAVPQVWLRAQPGQDRLYGWVQGSDAGTPVALTDPSAATAFGDGAWHLATLSRTGSTVALAVDGGTPATAAGVTGAVTPGPADRSTGLRLGAKAGAGDDRFTGGLDEFRLYRTALTPAQIAALRDANAVDLAPDTDAALGVRLPFQVLDGATVPTRTPVAIEEDVSGHCADGTLLGGKPSLVDGRVGASAIAVGGTRPGVEVPYTPALDVGSGDFTYTAWFKYQAGTGDQALLWAYGSTSGQRSLWVRAQPSQDRLYAWVQTTTDSVAVALPDTSPATAFGNDSWHLMALTRTGGTVRLSVDGGAGASVDGLTGSLTAGAEQGVEGLRAGAKSTGTDVLTGALDEVRLYHRALSTAELATVAGSPDGSSGYYPGDLPALWWSFENQWTQQHDVVRLDDGPSTPDGSVHCVNARVDGGARLTPSGAFGAALTLDGTDDDVRLPYRSAVALGAGDFTISTEVRYRATPADPDQVLLWAYGTGAAERQVWLRVQPSQDRLYAAFETDTSTTMVTAADASAATAFGDGTWHQVALRRSGGTLQLLVDGAVVGSSAVPAGSVTVTDAFAVSGFELGAKPDGTNRFTGSLDEFRIHRRALTDQELVSVHTTNADLGTVTAVRLGFDSLSPNGFAKG
ncbi:LamG-like jellyroll fold domain-containing protein [Kitasatospora sp. NPDC057692]|uniref:LamG-like jellyroll fold domain-containing protein n=1 Tax=Kitasatospora sp. NPDC057692 TaxID=3346215 RepID=UPI00368FA12A